MQGVVGSSLEREAAHTGIDAATLGEFPLHFRDLVGERDRMFHSYALFTISTMLTAGWSAYTRFPTLCTTHSFSSLTSSRSISSSCIGRRFTCLPGRRIHRPRKDTVRFGMLSSISIIVRRSGDMRNTSNGSTIHEAVD